MSQNINVSTEMAQNSSLDDSRYTVRDLLQFGESLFTGSELYFGHGTDSAWDEAVCLLLFALDLDADTDRSVLDKKLTDIEQKEIKSLFNRRIQERVPAPYITGQAWFCGLPFVVDERVIIPRSPIAELIMNYFEPWLLKTPQRILDLCTGGGCIGISCAYGFDDADVVLSDISEEALAVADLNISKHELGQRVSSVHSDLFSGLLGQTFDLIVSNPPYVDAEDLGPISSPTKDSSLGRREIESVIINITSTPHIVKSKKKKYFNSFREILKKNRNYRSTILGLSLLRFFVFTMQFSLMLQAFGETIDISKHYCRETWVSVVLANRETASLMTYNNVVIKQGSKELKSTVIKMDNAVIVRFTPIDTVDLKVEFESTISNFSDTLKGQLDLAIKSN